MYRLCTTFIQAFWLKSCTIVHLYNVCRMLVALLCTVFWIVEPARLWFSPLFITFVQPFVEKTAKKVLRGLERSNEAEVLEPMRMVSLKGSGSQGSTAGLAQAPGCLWSPLRKGKSFGMDKGGKEKSKRPKGAAARPRQGRGGGARPKGPNIDYPIGPAHNSTG